MAYATVQDLEDRWRILSPRERQVAEVLLDDAELAIRTFGTTLKDCDQRDREMLAVVSCWLVRDAMEDHGDAFGLGQETAEAAWNPVLPAGTINPWNYRSFLQPPRRNARIGSIPFEGC